MPQARCGLWPMTIKGVPGKVNPTLSKRPPCNPFSYHGDGICKSVCVSLARIGIPVVVRLPWTTQLLLPQVKDGLPSHLSASLKAKSKFVGRLKLLMVEGRIDGVSLSKGGKSCCIAFSPSWAATRDRTISSL